MYGVHGTWCTIHVHTNVTLTCNLAAVDVQTISNELSGVDNWEGLAGWLDIESSPIQSECQPKLNGAKHECYRRSLVQRYYNKHPSEGPKEVAEHIAQVLEEKMGHKLQADQLRELRFGECAGDNGVHFLFNF